MDMLTQLESDRANLAQNLENMRRDYEELGRRLNQQAGALQYCDMVLERVRGEQAQEPPGATPAA